MTDTEKKSTRLDDESVPAVRAVLFGGIDDDDIVIWLTIRLCRRFPALR